MWFLGLDQAEVGRRFTPAWTLLSILWAPLAGNAYTSDRPRVPTGLAEAARLFSESSAARRAFGDEVVDHYVRAAEVELEAFATEVTDWERYRSFERL